MFTIRQVKAFAKAWDKLAVKAMNSEAQQKHVEPGHLGDTRLVRWTCPDCQQPWRYSLALKRYVCRCDGKAAYGAAELHI